MTIRISGGSSTFKDLRISSGGTFCFIGSDGNTKACFSWIDPNKLLLKVLGSTGQTWVGDYVPPTPPDYAGVPMGLPGLAITYPE